MWPSGWTRADFRELLAGVRQVDASTWIASVSPQITRSGENGDRAARLLKDVPSPPKWNPSALDDVTTGDHHQFDTAVAKQVTCGWLKAWQQAKATGSATGLKSAGNALLSSKNWKLLKDLAEQGSDLRQSIMTMADRVVNGKADNAEIQTYLTSLC